MMQFQFPYKATVQLLMSHDVAAYQLNELAMTQKFSNSVLKLYVRNI